MDITTLQKIDAAVTALTELRKAILSEQIDLSPDLPLPSVRVCVCCDEPLEAGERTYRGAHERCYKKVTRAISAGKITDDEAVNEGLLLPREKGGRRYAAEDPLATMIARKRARKKS